MLSTRISEWRPALIVGQGANVAKREILVVNTHVNSDHAASGMLQALEAFTVGGVAARTGSNRVTETSAEWSAPCYRVAAL